MRKTRDYDAELRALSDKAKSIKAKKIEQLGLLVTATGADALDLDTLAGALLAVWLVPAGPLVLSFVAGGVFAAIRASAALTTGLGPVAACAATA